MTNPAVESALALKQQRRYTEAAQALRAHLAQNPEDAEAQGELMQIQELMMLEMQIQQKLKKARGQLLEGDQAGARSIAGEILALDAAHPEALEIMASAGAGSDASAAIIDGGDFMVADAPILDTPVEAGGDFVMADTPLMDTPVAAGADFAVADSSDFLASPGDFNTGFGGAEAAPATAAAGPALSGAENAKIRDFIEKGKVFLAAGNTQDAVDILTRVFIIDENNVEAQQLIDQARSQMDSAGAALDHEVNEAVGLFNAGEFARAKSAFGEVLKKSPNHSEALGYLSQIAQKESADAAALAAPDNFEIDSGAGAIPEAQAAAPEAPTPPAPDAPLAREAQPAFNRRTVAAAAPTAARAGSAGVPKWALGAAAAFVLAALAVVYVMFIKKPAEPVSAPVVAVKPVRAAPPPPVSVAAPPPAPVALDPHESELKELVSAGAIPAMLKAARAELDKRHYAHVRDLNTAILEKEPTNGEAVKLTETADLLDTEEQAYLKEYNQARTMLQQTDYAEALRLAWRLRHPEERLGIAARIGIKDKVFDVWSVSCYNASLMMLRNQNVQGALENLRDLIDVRKADPQAKALLDHANQYVDKQPDKPFFTYLNGLQFQPTPAE